MISGAFRRTDHCYRSATDEQSVFPPRDVISTVLKHDAKITSYKLALLRSINDVVPSFPDLARDGRDVAVPLRSLADF